jgi:alpha-tubulin suppressor-like RCC1 family protein
VPTPSEIQTCIDNLTTSSQPIDFTLLAAETSNASTLRISFSVATVDDLPDLSVASISPGQIVFVESIGVPVVNTVDSWKGLDGRLLRRDFVATSLFTWGSNHLGRLGDGTIDSKCSPVREICSSIDWCQVSAGNSHSTAVKTSGELWSWGYNNSFHLGDGTLTTRCSPVREISSSTDWCQASGGSSHSAAIKTSGELWAWGSNASGRLGDGTLTNRCSPVREFCSATDWCQVSAESATAAIKTSGELWAWGNNYCGRLGDGTTTDKCSPVREISSSTDWCQVSAGGVRSHAIKTSGELWSWGQNASGRLGDGTTTSRCSPVREFCSATDWCQVSAGSAHSTAVKTSGELWAWGYNTCGRLGDGTLTVKCSPVREISSSTDWCQVSAGNTHSAAIKTSGELWAWGSSGCGRLGDGTITNRCSPVREISSSIDWCQVSAGNSHSAAIKSKL